MSTLRTSGTSAGTGPILVTGNVDGQPGSEILTTGIITGPLYAWHSDGSAVAGWPYSGYAGFQHPVVGHCLDGAGLQVFTQVLTSPSGGKLVLLDQNGIVQTGWPKNAPNYVSSPGSTCDLDNDGLDEILCGSESRFVYIYRGTGASYPGWPRYYSAQGGQKRDTPFVADLDGDTFPEIVVQDEETSSGRLLIAYRADGTYFPGYPVELHDPVYLAAIADIDRDGIPELICPMSGTIGRHIEILNADASIRSNINLGGDNTSYPSIAIGDLDGDDIPEIAISDDLGMDVIHTDGSHMLGWPITWVAPSDRHSGGFPLIGDVDGDGFPDVVVQTGFRYYNQVQGDIRVYNRFGTLHPHFPKTLDIGGGYCGVIEDIDQDGRTDILVNGNSLASGPQFFPRVWAYDLHGASYGPVYWGQYMGGPKHTGLYLPLNSIAFPRSMNITSGQLISGGVTSIRRSDNVRASFGDHPWTNDVAEAVLTTYLPELIPAKLGIRVEGFGNSKAIQQQIELFDYQSSNWVLIDSRYCPVVESVMEVQTSVSPSRFIQGNTRQVTARIRWTYTPFAKQFQDIDYWGVQVDQCVWTIQRF